jgi:hypothetical protein
LHKLDCNLCRPRDFLRHIDDTALLLFPGTRVLHQESLLGCHQIRQGYQCSVGTDDKCLCTRRELWAFPSASTYDYRNAQLNSLAAPLLRPLLALAVLLTRHCTRRSVHSQETGNPLFPLLTGHSLASPNIPVLLRRSGGVSKNELGGELHDPRTRRGNGRSKGR